MGRGRPKAKLVVSPWERARLQEWTRRRSTAQALALRARIVLACAEGQDNIDVAEQLGVTHQTVGKWRQRFVERRLDGLLDEPRPGGPRRISDAKIEDVIVKTLESKPRDATHWSTRSMAKATGLSQSTISRIWRGFVLQPHRSETFKLSTDPLFIDKVRDVVGLYLNPPERALVLAVDEKSQIQALDRSQPLLPSVPDKRNGGRTTTSGMERPRCSQRWTSPADASSASSIAGTVPSSSASSSKSLKRAFPTNSTST
jgi:transposase